MTETRKKNRFPDKGMEIWDAYKTHNKEKEAGSIANMSMTTR